MAGIIVYDFFESQFGECLIARSGKGVCFLDFVIDTRDESRCRLAIAHAGETLCRRPGGLDHLADMAFDPAGAAKLEVDLRGTDFQVTVWNVLRTIKPGTTTTYAWVASRIGRPNAVRAVAGAIARNRVACLIPCHRVIRSDGDLGGYRWGVELKSRLLEFEKARHPRHGPAYQPIFEEEIKNKIFVPATF